MNDRTSITGTRARGTADSHAGPTPAAAALDSAAVASGLNVLAGVWLIIAPWVLDYSSQNNAVWNQVTVGIVIAVLAFTRAATPDRFESLSWVNFVLGAWLIIAPFLLAYNDTTNTAAIYWNDIIMGVIVLGLAGWSAAATRSSR